MPQPAARVTDMHVCPMMTPGLPPVPMSVDLCCRQALRLYSLVDYLQLHWGLRHFVPDQWMPLLWEVLKFLYAANRQHEWVISVLMGGQLSADVLRY